LAEIAEAMGATPQDLLRILDTHSAGMRRKADEALKLVDRLDHMTGRLRTHTLQSIDEALAAIQAVPLFERYFDRNQLNDIREDARELGEQVIREAEAEWPT
jgi:hypothetical protein